MTIAKYAFALFLLTSPSRFLAQGLDPNDIVHPKSGAWPTYNGDYSGQRFSSLTEINPTNIANLGLAWTFSTGLQGPNIPAIKSTPLEVDGILYFTVPDNVWALDARTGREIWKYHCESKGGIHIGNRGVGIYRDWLYFETPDDHLVSLNKNTGKFRWSVTIADLDLEYFATAAPLVIKNHIIVGVGGDSLDVPGYLEARDPETGEVQWHFNTTPRSGEPGIETWPNLEASAHGGGMTWLSGTYDPQLNLYYFGTGNPNPVYAGQSRKGDNLYTASILAINPDTGKMAWYFQASPHDTHDWDAVETPVLLDMEINGQNRKLLAQASRNGYFFVLDRINGKNIYSVPFVNLNWSKGVNANGNPIPDPEKFPAVSGVIIAPAVAAANWPPPSYNPSTGLFYVNAYEGYQLWYLTDTTPNPEGYGGSTTKLWSRPVLKAIDVKAGKIRWSHPYESDLSSGMSGILNTAGNLLFAGDATGHLVAFNPDDGQILWHAGVGALISNGPMTFELDGHQYIVVAAGNSIFAFTLNHQEQKHVHLEPYLSSPFEFAGARCFRSWCAIVRDNENRLALK